MKEKKQVSKKEIKKKKRIGRIDASKTVRMNKNRMWYLTIIIVDYSIV